MLLLSVSMGAQTLQRVPLPTQRLLPMSGISRILEDEEGYLWYGTAGSGILRDDGYHIDVFRADRLHPVLMANNEVLCMAENRTQHQIWFGTHAGAFIIDKTNYDVRPLRAGEHLMEGRHVEVMLAAADGTMWVAVRDSILHFAADGAVMGAYASTWQGRPAIVNAMAETAEGDVLVTQWEAGWGVLRKEAAFCFKELPWEQAYSPTQMAYDQRNGCWWVGTWGGGIAPSKSPRGGTCVSACIPEDMSSPPRGGWEGANAQILSLYMDEARGLLWATSMSGLEAYHTDGGVLRRADLSALQLPHHGILSQLCPDHHGNLYVGGFAPQTFIIPRAEASLQRIGTDEGDHVHSPNISHIEVEGDSLLWLLREHGQVVTHALPSGTNHVLAPPADLRGTVTDVMTLAPDGGIWAMTTEGDVLRLRHTDGGITCQTLCRLHEAPLCIADDGHTYLYIGTYKHLLRCHRRTGDRQVVADGTGMVRDICIAPCNPPVGEEETGEDVVVSFIAVGRGLCQIHPQADTAQVLAPYRQFNRIAAGRGGELWVSSTDGTVYRYDPATATLAETDASSFNGDAIKRIAFDGQHLWAITDQAVREYSPSMNEQRQLGATDSRIRLGYFGCVAATADGAWVGGARGVCHVARSATLDHQLPQAHVQLSAVELRGQRRPAPYGRQHLRIPPRESAEVGLFLTTAEHLTATDVRFSFQLQGLSDEWVILERGENVVRLIALPRGRYRLMVSVTDAEGLWSQPVEVTTLERLPYWWETWWARCLYVLVVAATAAAIWWDIRRQRRRREQFDRLLKLLREDSPPALPKGRERSLVTDASSSTGKGICSLPLGRAGGESLGRESGTAGSESALLQEESIELSDADRQWLDQAISTVKQHIDDTEYDVDHFARDMLVSRTTLLRRIRSVAGQSPTDFIKAIRLEHAAQLIAHSAYALSAISDMCGFSSASYFTKCFKQKYGVLPKNYKA